MEKITNIINVSPNQEIRPTGRPRTTGWKGQVHKDMRKMEEDAVDREGWWRVDGEAEYKWT